MEIDKQYRPNALPGALIILYSFVGLVCWRGNFSFANGSGWEALFGTGLSTIWLVYVCGEQSKLDELLLVLFTATLLAVALLVRALGLWQ